VTHGGHLRVRVLDIGGREIVTLADSWCSPGEHHTIWIGEDRSGEKAPAGMYFLRLEDGRGSPRASGRVLVLR
jgi:flagellar hook assembly protein FlgD